MLGKMMIHGLVAALLIGGGATVYAQATADGPAAPAGNGYLQPGTNGAHSEGAHAGKEDRKHDDRRNGQDRRHGHDD